MSYLHENIKKEVTSLSVLTPSQLLFKLMGLYISDLEDTFIVERLFSSSLVALVSLAAPRKLKVCHFKKDSEICNYSYPNTILSVKLNRVVRKFVFI